jgi:Dyp-type peroxidase family
MSNVDLFDIQGNIHRAYGRFGFPYARYMTFHIKAGESAAGRWFIDQIRPLVTTAEPWRNSQTPPEANVRDKPPVAVNIAFTWKGLLALELPTETLRLMPDEFIEGMPARKRILGDLPIDEQNLGSDPRNWDEVWRRSAHEDGAAIHVMVMLNAQPDRETGLPVHELAQWTEWFRKLVTYPESQNKVLLLRGHGRRPGAPEVPDDDFQDSNTLMQRGPDGRLFPTPNEPFGFMDGISDPVYEGQDAPAIGGGKIAPGPFDPIKSWSPLAAGEFLLGQPSEGQEIPPSAPPWEFMRNGTFMALRKLHQNTKSFDDSVMQHARVFKEVGGFDSIDAAAETLMAKMVGRWKSGIPLVAAPTKAEEAALLARFQPSLIKAEAWRLQEQGAQPPTDDDLRILEEFNNLLVKFRYVDDPDGIKCPLGSHLRRVNPRDMLDPEPDVQNKRASSQLTNRRRILRRGLPYGPVDPDAFAEAKKDDKAEHGVFIMALCSSLFRQFEFIQQQWIQYGLDLDSGNDACPITGRRDAENHQANKFVVPSDPKSGKAPYIAANLPQFVETHGGEYFFIPSITALRMVSTGSVDPT